METAVTFLHVSGLNAVVYVQCVFYTKIIQLLSLLDSDICHYIICCL